MHFNDIPPEGFSLEITGLSLPGLRDEITVKNSSAEVRLDRQGERVLCRGRLRATVILHCDRCLAAYDYAIDNDFRLVLEVVGPDDIGREHTCSAAEMDVVALTEPEVDVKDILQQQFFLNIPVKSLCSENCKGLCAHCGQDLNRTECGCRAAGSSPFDVLSTLKH